MRLQRPNTSQVVKAVGARLQKLDGRSFPRVEIETSRLCGSREREARTPELGERSMHLLPRGLLADRHPHNRERIDPDVPVAAVSGQRIETIVVSKDRLGRKMNERLHLAN